MRGELEVLQHRQVGEAAGARRHVGDLALGPAVWGPAADVDVSDADRAGGPGEQANDAQERGRLAGAVAAQQRHQFAVPDTEVEVEDDVALAVADVEPANLEHQKKDPTLVTGAAGRTGFAGPDELSRSPTKRGPPGGGPDPPHEISDFAGTPREGEACLPLHFMAGRTGFAGPIELSRWPTKRGPPGGGPDPPHEISDFAGTPREGEACLPLHLRSIRPRPRPRAPRDTPSGRRRWRALRRASLRSAHGPGALLSPFAPCRRPPPCRAHRRAGSGASPARRGAPAPSPSRSRRATCRPSVRQAAPTSSPARARSRSRLRADRRGTAGRPAAPRTGRARPPPAAPWPLRGTCGRRARKVGLCGLGGPASRIAGSAARSAWGRSS